MTDIGRHHRDLSFYIYSYASVYSGDVRVTRSDSTWQPATLHVPFGMWGVGKDTDTLADAAQYILKTGTKVDVY